MQPTLSPARGLARWLWISGAAADIAWDHARAATAAVALRPT